MHSAQVKHGNYHAGSTFNTDKCVWERKGEAAFGLARGSALPMRARVVLRLPLGTNLSYLITRPKPFCEAERVERMGNVYQKEE